jgi:sortase A
MEENGQQYSIWQVPDGVVGWHKTSAYPGHPGNIVLNGHHNIKGQVFRYLIDLEVGDQAVLYAGDRLYYYQITEKHILKEKGEPPEVQRENARWIAPTEDERLTMVTCWPYTNNTHRLVIVAKPVPAPDLGGLER